MAKHNRTAGSDVPRRDAPVNPPRTPDRRGEPNEQITNTNGWRGRHRRNG